MLAKAVATLASTGSTAPMTAMVRAGLNGPPPWVEGLGAPRPGGYGSGNLLVTLGARIPESPAFLCTAVPSPMVQLNPVYNRDQLWTEGFSRQRGPFDQTAAEKRRSEPS